MTRQREALFTALENWATVTDLATVSANSFGSAEEKMKAYSDSLLASQNRVTAAFEKWVLAVEGSKSLIGLNNILAGLIENVDILAKSFGILFALTNFDKFTTLGLEGLTTLGSKTSERGASLVTKGASLFEVFKNFKKSQNEERTSSNLIQGTFTSLREKFAQTIDETLYASLNNSLEKMIEKQTKLGQVLDESSKNITLNGQAALFSAKGLNANQTAAILNAWATQDSAVSQEVAAKMAKDLGLSGRQAEQATKLFTQELNKATKALILENAQAYQEVSGKSPFGTIAKGALSFTSGLAGMYTGAQLGGVIGDETGAAIGSAVGAGIMSAASTALMAIPGWGLLATVGLQVGSVFASTMVAGFEKEKEEAIKTATELAVEMENSYKSAISSTSKIERYDELVQGVDTLGRNVALSDDEYEEFLTISNELSETFPELKVRTDEMGNSFLGVSGKVGQVTDSVNELVEAMQRGYNLSMIDSNFGGESLSSAQEKIENLKESIKENQEEISRLNQEKNEYLNVFSEDGVKLTEVSSSYGNYAIEAGSSKTAQRINEILRQNGISTAMSNQNLEDFSRVYLSDSSQVEAVKSILDSEQYGKQLEQEISNLEVKNKEASQSIKEVMEELSPILSSQIQTVLGESAWNNYSEEFKQLFTSIASSIDLFDENGIRKDYDSYMREVENAIKNLQNYLLDQDNSLIVETYFSLDDSATVEEAQKARQEFLEFLLSTFGEDATIDEVNKVLVHFGFEYVPQEGASGTDKFKDSTGNIQDNEDIVQQLYDKGLTFGGQNVDYVRGQLREVDIATLQQAYKSFGDEVLRNIKTVNDFYDEVNKEKLKDDNLSFFISEYERLSEMSILSSTDEKYMKRLVERIKEYATAVGAAKDDWGDILDKAKQMPNTTLIGTTSKTMEEVQEQYQNYQEYLNYLTSEDFDGSSISADIYGQMMTDEALQPYLLTRDTEGLIKELQEYLASAENHAKGTFENIVAESENMTKMVLSQNADMVEGLAETYGVDLNVFSTFSQAKEFANNLLNGNIESAWATLNSNLESLYQQDMLTFAEYTAAKAESIAMLANLLDVNVLSKDEWAWSVEGTGWNESMEESYNAYLDGMKPVLSKVNTEQMKERIAEVGQAMADTMTELLNGVGYNATNVGGSSSSSSDSSSDAPTLEDILNSLKTSINKEFEAMLVYDSDTGLPTGDTKYFEKMRNVLTQQLENYNSMLGVAENEQERLDILSKIQDVQVELANLGDEELQDKMAIAELENQSLETRIEIQKQIIEEADTYEERLQQEKALNDLIKERENLLNAQKDLINKDYYDMLEFNGMEGMSEKYFAEQEAKLKELLSFYNEYLTRDISEEERLGVEKKIQEIKIEIANLDDEMLENQIKIAELSNASLETIIALKEALASTSDNTIEELEREEDIVETIKKRGELLEAQKDLIDKEYYNMLDYDGEDGKREEYFLAQQSKLLELKAFYNEYLKLNISEEERLDTLKKIQDIEKELANLDDELIEDALSLLEAQDVSLQTQIEIQKKLLESADTEEERVERQKELNELIKQEYEFRKNLNNFRIEDAQRKMDRIDVDDSAYEGLVQNQLDQVEKNISASLDMINKRGEELGKVYRAEGYSDEEIKELLTGSDELQSYYQDYIDALDKKTQILLGYAQERIEKIDFELNNLEMSKPQEWTSINQIMDYATKNIELLEQKIPILEEALENSANMTVDQIRDYTDQLNKVNQAIHQAKLEQQQDIVNFQEEIFSALTWQVNEYIDRINDQKEVIEDYYDTEIDKLNKVNEAKERSIELEKLQDALLNARKERQRVYKEGIGFVYETNREKVKQAEQDLEDFYINDKIADLNNTKEQELEVLNQRIENWNKYLEALQDAHDRYENSTKEHLLFELLNVQTQEELYNKMNEDMENYISLYNENVNKHGEINVEYIGIFGDFLNDYNESVQKLDELQKELIETIDAATSSIGEGLDDMVQTVVDSIDGMTDSVKDIINDLNNALAGLGNGVKPGLGSNGNKIETEYGFTYIPGPIDPNAGDYGGMFGIGDGHFWAGVGGSNIVIGGGLDPNIIYGGVSPDFGEDSAALLEAGKKYNEAKEKGDKEAMDYWHGIAESIRNEYGYSGGETGDQYIPLKWKDEFEDYISGGSSSSGGNNYDDDDDYWEDYWDPSHEDTGGGWYDDVVNDPDSPPEGVTNDDGTWSPFPGGPVYPARAQGGPIAYTGLAMLHGTPSKPEYVLNNDQAWQLLRNFSTMKMPEYSSNVNTSNQDIFNINGDIVLNDVKDPAQFWDKLMVSTRNRFNVTKKNH